MARCLATLVFVLFWAAPAASDTETRATMDEIFETVRFLLPLSLSENGFADPAQREVILAALTTLAENGSRLQAHGVQREASFVFLSRSLARDTAEARARYAKGEISQARFLLHRLVDNCVECHSRLPKGRDFPRGREFVESSAIAGLPPEERLILEVATRQFEPALESYEALFLAPAVSPAELDLLGHFDGYLELCLRTKRDPERAARVFERVAVRPDVSPPLRTNLNAWIASLRRLEKRGLPEPSIAAARALLDRAEDRKRFPDEHSALVEYVAASSLLHRFVVAPPLRSDGERAEAYGLLGLIESRVGRSFWLSQTEFYLETAIRLDPTGPYAEGAYDLLEEFVISGYTGSQGSFVPPDVRANLDALRRLMDDS
jgi:tetratricopeptide (TPR) repeat protein